jgi:hypothetical protein
VILTLLAGASIALIVWTIYLGWRLPKVYISQHWKLAWVGLDTLEVMGLILTTWSAYRRRVVLIFFASATATMFILDAWFDVTTARSGDVRQSILTALLIEIPAAIGLYFVAVVTLRRVLHRWSHLEGVVTSTALMTVEIPRTELG